jgi:glycosyltransferase involved in cell wall biosynthesis
MKKKVLTVLFNISKAQEHEWFVRFINRDAFELEFALINAKGSFMHQFLESHNVPCHHFTYSGKKDLPSLTYKLFLLMLRNKYDIVHAHLFEGTLAGMLAARLAGVKHRITTRHYSDFHHVWFPGAVKYDKLINSLTTKIVAISKNVENILLNYEHVRSEKVWLIHHGIDMDDYKPGAVNADRVTKLREKYGILPEQPVVGVISRFIELKGLQYLIPAFKDVLNTHPDAVLILANASGSYKQEVMNLLNDLDESRYRLIVFENDIAALYKLFSCFVHIPITASAEAFGQIYLEALASEIPSVFSLSGVAPEFAVDKENCLVVPFKNKEKVAEAIQFILDKGPSLERMVSNGYQVVATKFDVRTKIHKLEQLYSEA